MLKISRTNSRQIICIWSNQTESDLPRVNQPSLDLMKQMNAEWATLKSRGNEILEKDIPALNRQFWEAGKGAIWEE